MMKVQEQYRIKDGPFATDTYDGNNGLFLIPYSSGSWFFQCIVSDGMGWEHVSVTLRYKNSHKYEMPDWNQMCYIKDIFWDETDTVIQYHPAKSEYINNHPYVLHLWRPTDKELPIPDSIMVGIK
jgi:hypothetical protein